MALTHPDENVNYDETFITNSRGLKLFTCKWIPVGKEPKALIFICHGYAMECSITMSSTAMRLVKEGYAVYGMDYQGHGKSAGLEAYIQNFDDIINDCSDHFTSICEKEENKGKMRYLLGESMGGALVLLLHRKMPDFWDGTILVAPMCKIADNMKPSPPVTFLLKGICWLAPTWKLPIHTDIVEVAFKEAEIREEIRKNPYCYKGPLRMKTAFELLRVSLDIEKRLDEVKLPFIVLHGEDDKVTDQQVSKQLYNVASSTDKTLKLYPGMWHGLLYGEPLENIDIVFSDIVRWLEERTRLGDSRLEMERKLENDRLYVRKNNKL
ncbi:caffeoylshikimate esterase-like [Herrania umbratica]|uniref:Caffeoylshikimate esterase-like n=1 Tax=Herrania umbratica TaxID=108875 RepID=A0A6J1B9N9_9ROSI|nr:caffeoylshikimate esterase-like [Herrania umbratica]